MQTSPCGLVEETLNVGFGAQGAAGDPKPQMMNPEFGAQGAAGDPKPQMMNPGRDRVNAVEMLRRFPALVKAV
jgi:hypothetical protein